MAEFLTTVGTSYHIENIIKSSKVFLVLVSPYLKINNVLLERLVDTDSRGVNITIIYGKENLLGREREKLDKLNNLNIYFASNLHAKCYFNEKDAIISSMNLYEFSERNNREMSVLINSRKEKIIYKEIIEEIESIKNNSVVEQQCLRKETKNSTNDLSREEKREVFLSQYFSKLSEEYPNYNSNKGNEEITVCNFPFFGVKLTIDYILTFDFNKSTYELKGIRDRLIGNLLSRMESYRCYWNANRYNIRIYPADGYDMGFRGEELVKRVEYFFNAMEITKQFLFEYKIYFK
ncbi:phospholipase D family protein [Natronospora cellulosivora (SeqCode)]